MLRLQMESQPLRYELHVQPTKLQLRTESAKLQMESEAATLEIQAEQGELRIDHTPWRYSLGIKNNTDFVRDFANAGKAAALEAIARIVQEGHRLADISSGGNAIAEIAKANVRQPQAKVTFVPLAAPDISYVIKPVEYSSQPGQLRFSVIPGSVSNDTQPGSVNLQITQYSSLKIWTVGSMDMKA